MRTVSGPSAAPLMCVVGAAALVGQTVLVRELMVSFYGTELALAAVLSCWLLFIPVGALVAAGLLRRRDRSAMLLCCGLAGMAVGLPAEFLLARLVRPLLRAGTGEFLSVAAMLVGAALAAAPMAFWVGFFFPVAANAEERRAPGPGTGISRIYVAEAVGSACAGALLSLFLLSRLDPAGIVLAASAALLLCGAWYAAGASVGGFAAGVSALLALLVASAAAGRSDAFFALAPVPAAAVWARSDGPQARRLRTASGVLLALGVGVSLLSLIGAQRLSEWSMGARWRTFSRFRLLAARDSRYQHIELGERQGTYVLVQDGYHTAQFPEPGAVRARAALLLTQHPRPRDVLVVGGGLGGLCQQMLQFGVERLDYVEPDPALITLLHEHLPPDLREPLRDERFAAYLCDGRYFVRTAFEAPGTLRRRTFRTGGRDDRTRAPAGVYDLVIVNTGDPVSASGSRFYTAEFCRELQRILSDEGVAAFCGITGSENYLAAGPVLRYGVTLHKTLRSVFQRVIIRPGEELCFFAGPGASSSPDVLVERFERQGLAPDPLKHAFRLAQFPSERVTWVERLFREAAPAVPVNTDAQPVLFTLFLGVQSYYARGAEVRGGGGDPFAAMRSLPRAWLWAPFAVIPALVGLFRALRKRAGAVAWGCRFSVFATGVFGLAAAMLIVYRYQTSFGYVYRDVSILVGLFMLGLAAGGWLMGRRGGEADRSVLLAVGGGQATFLLGLPASLGLLSASPPAFMLASSMAGFLTGAEFPLAARISLGTGARAGTVAGSLDAADHLGALAGAACTGLLLVPALGVVQTAAVVALLKCAALGGLVLAFTPERRS